MPLPSNLGWIAVAIGAMIALFLVSNLIAKRRSHQFPDSLEKLMADAAERAVSRARSRYQVRLDYTIDSLRNLDAVFKKLHAELGASPELVDPKSVAFTYGAYIGETIRRSHVDAVWGRIHDAYPLKVGARMCHPVAWCTERLFDADATPLWQRYEKLMQPDDAVPKSRSVSAGNGL